MKRYRVLVVTLGSADKVYYPQWRWVFWPVWFLFWTSHTGHDCSALCYSERAQAVADIPSGCVYHYAHTKLPS
jgi:hypothetical protein